MKILIVVDMQNDFLTGSLKNDAAVAIRDSVVEKIKNFDGVVMATMDTHSRDYLQTQEGKNLPVMHCVKGTQGWELDEKISKAIEAVDGFVYCKKSFGDMLLPRFIEQIVYGGEDVSEIELCGTCTGICVISNALILKAAFPEIPIIVDAKNCACLTQETHETALKTMELCQIIIKRG